MQGTKPRVLEEIPAETVEWLLQPDNPAVAVLTRRELLKEMDDEEICALWEQRNEYPPTATILAAQHEDGSWDTPARDYQKYGGSLWQIVFLGELWADGGDSRVQRAAEYAFSRQKSDGTWSANPKASYFMPCLTANVGRALARMGWARDERVVASVAAIAEGYQRLGFLGCSDMQPFSLNGYCHMLVPKVLLLLAEVPRELWTTGAEELRDACVATLREREVFRSLPDEFSAFKDEIWPLPAAERAAGRERFLAEHEPLHYGDKPGWRRFGYPLSYNSDALESLWALMRICESPRDEYLPAIKLVRAEADPQMRWTLKNTFNGKMLANIEAKGKPSKWLTLRALQVLAWADG
ncbi:MAG: hypothetical protein CVT67_11535 [Actinobacteria bacterium HGW-Actinobacteria-7]|jgi:hypothetical protein|nr:MAG: hypothetical protein CVT67_11535 [Actinobacteria bacterium HGW-Actinobacteria-7]